MKPQEKSKKMKANSLDEIEAKKFGKKGTANRDQYENKLK
jgi:hypothetical protein